MDRTNAFLRRHCWELSPSRKITSLVIDVKVRAPYPHYAYTLKKGDVVVTTVFTRSELYYARDPARHVAVRIRSAYRRLKKALQANNEHLHTGR